MVKTMVSNQKKLERVGVIGCGWLGSALVTALVKSNYYVVATTQTKEKLAHIESLNAQAELLRLPFYADEGNNAAVFYCQTIVICIPPQLRRGKIDYPEKIAQIVKQAERGTVKKIILIGTTAIYDGVIGDVTEATKLKREIEKVSILASAEDHVLAFNGYSVILRSAGLVGEGRHPGNFFRHSKQLSAPNSYVNLIHQADVVGQILAFIKAGNKAGIFNAVSEMQVTKKHFYSMAASAVNIALPEFDKHSEVELGKQVIGNKVKDYLNYQFQYGDLVTWLMRP